MGETQKIHEIPVFSYSFPYYHSGLARFISHSNTLSLKLLIGPVRSVSALAIISFVHSRKVKRRNIPASAIFSTKLASSTLSPASARARRIPSAENVCTAFFNVMKFPVDLDIFSEFSSR